MTVTSPPPSTWSIRELKSHLDAHGISYIHCTEKSELVHLLSVRAFPFQALGRLHSLERVWLTTTYAA